MNARPSKRRMVVLLVDDDELPRKALRRAFEVVDAEDFTFDVLEAQSVAEYHQVIKVHHLDVMVVDLRLLSAEEGIDDFMQLHHVLSPDTLIIAFSGFPNLDPLQSCVRAMRAGAIDCIDKARPDGIECVVARTLADLRDRFSPHTGPSSSWLEQQLPDLVEKYGGQAIALLSQQVVANAPTVPQLRSQLAQINLSATPFLMVVPNWNESR